MLYTRLSEYALAKTHGALALERYRSIGNRGGEGQTLLCLADIIRLQRGRERWPEALAQLDAARAIFDEQNAAYSLARTYNYLGLLATADSMERALELFERALVESRGAGNRALEPLVLMNLGVAHGNLENRQDAVRYLRESQELYLRYGDERRATEIDTNLAEALVEYGLDLEDGLRRATNAARVHESLGDKDFEVAARRIIGAYHRYTGQPRQALTELNRALAIARTSELRDEVAALTVDIGRAHLLLPDYRAARATFESAVETAIGPARAQAFVELGRAQMRGGDGEAARTSLEPGFPFCLPRMAPLYTRGPPSARNSVHRTIVQLQRPSPQPALTCDRLEPLLSGHSSDTAPHLCPFFVRRASLHSPRVSLPGPVAPRSSAACRRTAAGSDALPPAGASSTSRASPAGLRFSPAAAASSSATSA